MQYQPILKKDPAIVTPRAFVQVRVTEAFRWLVAYREDFATTSGVDHNSATGPRSFLAQMQIEPDKAEGPLACMSVRGFEVTGAVCGGGIPQATAQVGENWQGRIQLAYFTDKAAVFKDRTDTIEQALLFALEVPEHFVHVVETLWSQLGRRSLSGHRFDAETPRLPAEVGNCFGFAYLIVPSSPNGTTEDDTHEAAQ